MIAAAKNTGINITLCPIFYQKGGFGKDPVEGQRRFISKTVDDYLNLYKASEDACKYYDGANVAIGIHSMRGVEPRDIIEVSKAGPQKVPFHIHISEQLKEVEDSIAYLDRRPVEWLIENVELSDRFHLVHATHLSEEETKGIAQTGANVVLCPTTEGNLGDGLFPLDYFHKCGGNWSIGTDSHVGINPLEELRLLDYGQRLVSHTRDTFAGTHGDSGRFAIEMPLIAGRKAMNNYQHEFFSVGEKLNVSNLDLKAPLLRNTIDKNILSTLVYSSDSSQQRNTIVNGKTVVKNGKHGRSEEISNRFSQTMLRLALR
jgi:formimidoylglutamate deiminase